MTVAGRALSGPFKQAGVLIVDGQPSYVSVSHQDLAAARTWRVDETPLGGPVA